MSDVINTYGDKMERRCERFVRQPSGFYLHVAPIETAARCNSLLATGTSDIIRLYIGLREFSARVSKVTCMIEISKRGESQAFHGSSIDQFE